MVSAARRLLADGIAGPTTTQYLSLDFLSPIAAANSTLFLDVFRQGLKETGFVDGQNVKIEYRWARGPIRPAPSVGSGTREDARGSHLHNRRRSVRGEGGATPGRSRRDSNRVCFGR